MCNSGQQQETTTTWHAIKDGVAEQMPDADAEIMVYDAELDDVFLAHLDCYDTDPIWVDNSTDDPLPAPSYWAEKPFPEGV